MAVGVKVLLQEPVYDYRSQNVAVGVKVFLQEPIYGYRSHNVTVEAQMWQRLDQPCFGCRIPGMAAGAKMCRSQDMTAGVKM